MCGPPAATPQHSLTGRRIGNSGARIVAAAMPQCPALRTLWYVRVSTIDRRWEVYSGPGPLYRCVRRTLYRPARQPSKQQHRRRRRTRACGCVDALRGPADALIHGCGRMGAYLGGWDGGLAPDALAHGPIIQPRHHSLYINSIGAEGASALAAALPQCTALQTLKYVGVVAWVRVWGGWDGGLAPDAVAHGPITATRTTVLT